MSDIDPEQQWRDLRSNYSRMTEGELMAVIADLDELTPVAVEAVKAELAGRGLDLATVAKSQAEEPELVSDEPPDIDADDLVTLVRLWDESEARRIKGILDAASIPSYLGPENVFDLAELIENFAAGVDLKVSVKVRDHAQATLREAGSEEEEIAEDLAEEDKKYAVVCPKCRSEEVVFEGEDSPEDNPTSALRFNWNCADCGHEWKDDGIAHVV
jgi:DNA-directed RNA polymerase subunit M/transcription elongation factor TFIIS